MLKHAQCHEISWITCVMVHALVSLCLWERLGPQWRIPRPEHGLTLHRVYPVLVSDCFNVGMLSEPFLDEWSCCWSKGLIKVRLTLQNTQRVNKTWCVTVNLPAAVIKWTCCQNRGREEAILGSDGFCRLKAVFPAQECAACRLLRCSTYITLTICSLIPALSTELIWSSLKVSSVDDESAESTKNTSVVSCRKADQRAADIWFHVCHFLIGGLGGSGRGHMGSAGQRPRDLLVTQ